MSHKTFNEIVERWWTEICHNVKAALLFMDDAAAESLHWHGGLNRVLDAGAVGAKNFSPFEKINSIQRKAVFILTSPLVEETLRTIMVIVRSNSFKNCVVITSLPPKCHCDERLDSEQIFPSLENRLLIWMGNMNYSAQVHYIPLFAACLSEEVFIIPAFSKSLSPLCCAVLNSNQVKKSAESSSKQVSPEIQTSIKMLVHCLNALLDGLQVKGDIFSIGHVSSIAGADLENLCHAKRKNYPAKASLLLVDRCLDLAGPLSQQVETLLGKMLKALPHLPGHVSDVSVCMTDLAASSSDMVFGRPLLAPGCIAHKSNPVEVEVLNTILMSKHKEAVMEINRRVVQLAEGIAFDSSCSTTPKVLKKRVLSYKEIPKLLVKNIGLLQQALAVVQTLEHPSNSYLDNLLATEKLLIQNLSLSRDGVAEDIVRLITSRKERGYKLVDIMTLIGFLYALSGPDVLKDEDESTVQATIMEALFQEDAEVEELVRNLVDDNADDQSILVAVKTFFHVIKQLGNIRKDFKKYKSVFNSGNPALPATYIPLLKQIMVDIFKCSEIPDMEFHSAGLRDYIKTGFSLFMNVAKPQPRDNPLIIIIVLGGITASEIRLIHEAAARQQKVQILVGSTSLLTPADVMSDIFNVVKDLSATVEVAEEL